MAWYRKIALVLLAALMAAALVSPAPVKARVSLKEAGFKVIDMAAIFLAKEKGFFDQQDVDFEYVEIDSGKLGVAALISGNVQVVDLGVDDVVALQQQGKEIVLFYSMVNSLTMDMVMRKEVADQKGITPATPLEQRFAALKGLRIGITRPGAPTDLYPRYYMKQVGLDPDRDATFIPIGGGSALMAAMKTGQIDAYMLSAPTPYILEKEGIGVVLIKASAGDVPIFKDYAFESVAALKSYAQANPDTLRAYSRAVSQAARWMADNRDEAVQILHDNYFQDSDLDTLRISFDALLPAIKPDGKLSQTGIQNQVTVLKAIGAIEGDVDTAEGNLWTTQYTE